MIGSDLSEFISKIRNEMGKQELVEKLNEHGILVHIEDGVVMLLVSEKEYRKPTQITNLIKELGYKESWGMKPEQSQLSLIPDSTIPNMTGKTNTLQQ